MRFMVLMIPQVYRGNKAPGAEAHDVKMYEDMNRFNQEMLKAGVMIGDGLGLHPLTTGARVTFAGGKPKVTDGPFVETKEVLGGYWMLQVKNKEEAINWMKKCPAQAGDIIEIRQVFEESEFPAEVQEALKQ